MSIQSESIKYGYKYSKTPIVHSRPVNDKKEAIYLFSIRLPKIILEKSSMPVKFTHEVKENILPNQLPGLKCLIKRFIDNNI